MSLTHDINGKKSSKRYWARVFFILGFWLVIAMFLSWIISFILDKEFAIPDQLIEVWKWLMGFASAVIIGTVFEKKAV